MNPAPVVSVVLPVYNGGSTLPLALESIYRQTLTDWELILIDDGSTDRTADVIRGFGAPVRYVGQRNAGVSAARNTGAALASGTFIAFLD